MAGAVKRGYDASRRQAAARETQAHIAEAARELFVERGYVATSIRDVAERAGVSVQTIYNAFDGGKAALFRRVMDIVIVGDDEPVGLLERPEYRAMFETNDPKKVLGFGVALSMGLYGRMRPLIPTIREAVAAEPAIAEGWAENYGRNRYDGVRSWVSRLGELGGLRAGVDVARAADIVWTLLSLENYEALVVKRDWSVDDYTAWAFQTLQASLLKGR
jgi:AcrR family transcriptional regulator